MKSCKVLAQTKNKNGEVVQSKLFKDLLQYTNQDRKKATQLYRIAKDARFLELAGDTLQYDENGEVTVKSLIDVTGDSFSDDAVVKKLNKDIENRAFEQSNALFFCFFKIDVSLEV